MAKVILWTNKDKPIKFSQRNVRWLNDHGVEKTPKHCEDYDNFNQVLIASVEAMRSETMQVLQKELSLCESYQYQQVHFTQILNNFEAYVTRFWMNLLEVNPQIFGSPKLERLHGAIMYLYSWEDFQNACKELSLNLPDNAQARFEALINRREVVRNLREKRDAAHDAYRKFCCDVGMIPFTHVPPADEFDIVEYDEAKYQAEIKIHRGLNGCAYEELELIPLI